jgi:hypothetical protein
MRLGIFGPKEVGRGGLVQKDLLKIGRSTLREPPLVRSRVYPDAIALGAESAPTRCEIDLKTPRSLKASKKILRRRARTGAGVAAPRCRRLTEDHEWNQGKPASVPLSLICNVKGAR